MYTLLCSENMQIAMFSSAALVTTMWVLKCLCVLSYIVADPDSIFMILTCVETSEFWILLLDVVNVMGYCQPHSYHLQINLC